MFAISDARILMARPHWHRSRQKVDGATFYRLRRQRERDFTELQSWHRLGL